MKVSASRTTLLATMALASLLGGCNGHIGDAGATGEALNRCDPGRSPLRRLNRAEYKSTIGDLLHLPADVADTFPPDEAGLGFTNNADSLVVTGLLAEAYMTAAESLAAAAVKNLSALLPCDPAAGGEDPCAEQFIADFGLHAFRRPLTDAEKTRFFDLYQAGKTGETYADGISLVIEALLQSPHFLYRVERGTSTTSSPGVARLGQYEMASRLSYFFWGSMPDDALLDAARDGLLSTPAQIEAEVRRMLDDQRARRAVADFHREWLSTTGVVGTQKDANLFPEWTPDLRANLANELTTFVDQVFWTDGRVETFFTAPYSFVNADLAKFYGLSPPSGTGFVKIDLDPAQRAGVLTQSALLALHAKPNQTSPVHRGKFVREQFLCQELPPPPANLVIVPPDLDPSLTTRERFAAHSADPSCAQCHRLMDPVGLGFEHYDPLGRWRDKEGTLEIDASGEVVGTNTALDGTFDGAVELAQKLASSATVRECMVKQWFRYANGRAETSADACTLQQLSEDFDADHDLRELRVKIALSDAFRFRSTLGGGNP